MPFLMDLPSIELRTGLTRLQGSGKYSDLKIKCGSKEYAVHKAIVCSRAEFFDGACSNPFLEAQTGVIDLSEDDEETIEHMINYFYKLDYKNEETSAPGHYYPVPPSPRSPKSPRSIRKRRRSIRLRNLQFEDPLLAQASATSKSSDSPFASSRPVDDPLDLKKQSSELEVYDTEDEIDDRFDMRFPEDHFPEHEIEPAISQDRIITHVKVYAIAEKFGIPGLKALARKKFLTILPSNIANESFSSTVLESYISTIDSDRGLRDPIIQLFREQPDLAYRPDIQEAMDDAPQLAWEIERAVNGMPIR